jgi:hypothetical protein
MAICLALPRLAPLHLGMSSTNRPFVLIACSPRSLSPPAPPRSRSETSLQLQLVPKVDGYPSSVGRAGARASCLHRRARVCVAHLLPPAGATLLPVQLLADAVKARLGVCPGPFSACNRPVRVAFESCRRSQQSSRWFQREAARVPARLSCSRPAPPRRVPQVSRACCSSQASTTRSRAAPPRRARVFHYR